MRFEKLTENKIRITLSHDDLIKKDIDFHSFMSNSLESQALFFDMLEEAEKEIGFVTKDYLIKIEALAMSSGDFVLTITRSMPKKRFSFSQSSEKLNINKKQVHIKKKTNTSNELSLIYKFNSFDEYCSFIEFYKTNFKTNSFAKKILLFEYNTQYYLVIINVNSNFEELKKLLSCITEFGTCVQNTEVFIKKLYEDGNLIMKHNAISTSIKHFTK